MWYIQFRCSANGSRRLVLVFDEDDVIQWSGQSILAAFRFVEEQNKVEIRVDVESAVLYLDPANAA